MFVLNLYKNKRLWVIISVAILIAMSLIIITFTSVFTISNNIVKINKNDFLTLQSYYTEYELNVYSNKNQNKYYIKEWYQQNNESDGKFRLETNNDGSNFTYILANNSLSIQSDNQLNYMKMNDYLLDRKNVASVSTFLAILNKIHNKENSKLNNECCKLKIEEVDNKLCYSITLNGNSDKNCDICNEYKNLMYSGMKILSFQLVLDKDSLMPLEYIVYTIDGKTWADIIFTKFNLNAEFDEKIFAF
ncbi:MAG: hypothetical protein PHP54_01205 [Clostridia bacterium]|nr:hypothetical protein [Clostridia bacterium]